MAHTEKIVTLMPRESAGDVLAEQLSRALPQTATARAEWNEIELAIIDIASHQADDVAQLEGLLAEQGATVMGSTGQERLSPVFAELRQSRLALAKMLGELRLPDQGPMSKNPVKQRAANRRWDRERANG